MKKNKIIKSIILFMIIISVIVSILIINSSETKFNFISRINSTTKSKASALIYGQTIEGVHKGGTGNGFANEMPLGTLVLDKTKISTVRVGKDGFELNTNGNDNIYKYHYKELNQDLVAYKGPNGNGIPKKTEGYITNSGLSKTASEEDRSQFTMKFSDAITTQTYEKKDVKITISNVYITNQRNDVVSIFAGWGGNFCAVRPLDSNGEALVFSSDGVGMKCDVSFCVLNKDGTPLEGESILFETTDLDVPDLTRQGSENMKFPKIDDNRFPATEGKIEAYESDYRESLLILDGALCDAYIPETNTLEVRRIQDGTYSNGVRFSPYADFGDDNFSLNSGFVTVVDSTKAKFRWYGSSGGVSLSTSLFTSAINHNIKASSSLGGFIRVDYDFNYVDNSTVVKNSNDSPTRTFQHDFMDGVNVPYTMQADSGNYLEKIVIDNVEFLPSDFSSISAGEEDKNVTITKNEKEYSFVATKDQDGNITKAVYTFNNNVANHEISVKWDGANISEYKVEYYYDGEIDATKTETKEAEIGKIVENYTDKNKEGYRFEKVEGTPLTIDADSTKNIIKVYYVKIAKSSYTVNYVEKDTNNPVHDPKTVNDVEVDTIINAQDEVIDIENYDYNSSDKENITIVEDSNNNVITLYYTKKVVKSSYTINYVEKDTNNPIHDPKTVNDVEVDTIINAQDEIIDIENYDYNSSDKENITIVEDSNNNVITLYYTKKVVKSSYTVNYVEKDTNNPIHDPKTVNDVEVDTIINAQDEIIDIANYRYDSSDKQSITIVQDSRNNVITLSYTKNNNNLSYTVNYLDKDTKNPIHNPKVIEKVELGTIINAQDEVIDIEKYLYDSNDKEKLTIDEDNDKNVINLYYAKKTGKVVVKYIDETTEKEITDSEKIEGKVDDDYNSTAKTIEGYELSKNSGNTSGKITEEDITVIYYYKAKAKDTTPKNDTTPAKQEVTTLPKTGNASILSIIIAIVAILGAFFAIGYRKLKDIK